MRYCEGAFEQKNVLKAKRLAVLLALHEDRLAGAKAVTILDIRAVSWHLYACVIWLKPSPQSDEYARG